MFSGWGVGRLAVLDVKAIFHGPFPLASKLTSVELVEGLNMWKTRGIERNRYTTPSPFQKMFHFGQLYSLIDTKLTRIVLDLLRRT